MDQQSAQAGAEPLAGFIPYTRFPQVEALLEEQLGERARIKMPERWPDNLVRFLPWAYLLALPLHLAAVLALLGLSVLGAMFGDASVVQSLISLGVLCLTIMALPGLFKRSQRGWELWVYTIALMSLGDLLSVSLVGLLVQVVVFWMAFQIKYRFR